MQGLLFAGNHQEAPDALAVRTSLLTEQRNLRENRSMGLGMFNSDRETELKNHVCLIIFKMYSVRLKTGKEICSALRP